MTPELHSTNTSTKALRNKLWRETNASYLRDLRFVCRSVKRRHIQMIKSSPCMDCGNSYIKEAMTFDHRQNEVKSYNIFRLVNHPTASLEKLKSELTKCDLVCVGCHRDRSNSRLLPYVTTCPVHRPKYVSGCKKCIHYTSLSRLRAKRLAMIREFKNKPCVDCLNKYDPWKMDFDHVIDKLDNVSNLVGCQASFNRIVSEIHKCEIVCCWCHVNRTVSRMEAQNDKF
jgi:hypothetical protein